MNTYRYPYALITADDWGMSPGVNDGILELAKRGVVRRVSCLAQGKYLTHKLDELLSIPTITVGLHFDLTFGRSRKEIYALILTSFFRPKMLKETVLSSFRSQWKTLVSLGIAPSYIDGHHHIHLLPGVLSALLEEAQFAGVKTIRTLCDPALLFSTKLLFVVLSLFSRSKIRKQGISTLPCWYPNLERIGVTRFKNGLRALKAETEIIVHPARTNDLKELSVPDSYADERIGEFRVLEMI